MINRISILLFISILVFGSCRYAPYLPKANQVGTNVYGSQITVDPKNRIQIRGELLAIKDSSLFVKKSVGSIKQPEIIRIPINEILNFRLRYIKPQNYSWTIPVFSLFTASHGMFLVFTFPINLLTTVIVATSSDASFVYTKKDISFKDLNMFARFPQGIPEGIDLAKLK